MSLLKEGFEVKQIFTPYVNENEEIESYLNDGWEIKGYSIVPKNGAYVLLIKNNPQGYTSKSQTLTIQPV